MTGKAKSRRLLQRIRNYPPPPDALRPDLPDDKLLRQYLDTPWARKEFERELIRIRAVDVMINELIRQGIDMDPVPVARGVSESDEAMRLLLGGRETSEVLSVAGFHLRHGRIVDGGSP
jgi:hypothetical protein